jgi:hypothetical protein
MQLTEANMENKFAVITNAATVHYDNSDPYEEYKSDYISEFTIFSMHEFETVSAFITLIQDIYRHQKDIQRWMGEQLNICIFFDEYALTYLNHHGVISIANNDTRRITHIIQNECYPLIPYTNNEDKKFPNKICNIKIFKNSKLFTVAEPTEDDVEEALKHISNFIKDKIEKGTY